MIKVYNSGKNFFEIETNEGRILQSYEKIICKINKKGEIILDKNYWEYSTTTAKHRNNFLNRTTQELKKMIKNNEIKFENLNTEN